MTDDITPSATADSSNGGTQATRQFEMLRVYLKDASFEAPSLPQAFIENATRPQKSDLDFVLNYHAINQADGLIEVTLDITVTSSRESETLYLAEIQQGGLFRIIHPDPAARSQALEITCPHLLLPFAREEINSLITKGGFPPFLLSVINFEMIYQDKLKQQAKKQDSTPDPQLLN